MTITEFLLARIAEDETLARSPLGEHRWQAAMPLRRMLAECEAKRRIVELQAANDEDRYLPGFHYKAQLIERVLRDLASIYADHPDYREEWRAD